MSEVRFYTDEHVAKAVTTGLRLRGVDALSVAEAGMLAATDEEHMALALAEQRVIVTQDDDFLRLASQGHRHAGIVYARHQTPIGTIIRDLLVIHHVLSAEDMIGSIEYL